jgi:plastocyanin
MTRLRGLTILFAALGALIAAAPTLAATPNVPNVQITHTGFVPATVTIAAGGSVNWVNNDTVEHDLASTAAKLAQTTLKPTDSYGFTFATPGTFTVTDPKNPSLTMTVVVEQAKLVTVHLKSQPRSVVFGTWVKLLGDLNPGQDGQPIAIEAQPCGNQKWSTVKTVTAGASGSFSVPVRPANNTTYRVRVGSSTATVGAHVTPRLLLRKLAGGKFKLTVQGPATGSRVAIQTRTGSNWKIVSTVKVSGLSRLLALGLEKGTMVRASMSTQQAGQCLDAGVSNEVIA